MFDNIVNNNISKLKDDINSKIATAIMIKIIQLRKNISLDSKPDDLDNYPDTDDE